MPLRRSVHQMDIDVDDSRFQEFYKDFQKYRDAVGKIPGAWAQANTAIDTGKGGLAEMTAAILAQNEMLHKMRTEAEGFTHSTRSSSTVMQTLARHTRDAAQHIRHATVDLLKWSTITGAIGGLVGAGGLFGLEDIAASAGRLRVGAARLGVAPTELQSYQAAYGNRIPDAGGFLSGINAMLQDITQQTGFYGAGMQRGQWAGKDAAQVAPEMLVQLRRIWMEAGPGMGATALQARGLGQFASQAQAAAQMSPEEFKEWEKNLRDYNEQLKKILTPQSMIAWQKFDSMLTLAKDKLEDTFINALSPLAPQLSRLSDVVSNFIVAASKSGEFKHWVDLATSGLKDLGDWLTLPAYKAQRAEFEANVVGFVKDVGSLSHAITKALDWIFKSDTAKKAGFVATVAGASALGGAVAGPVGAAVAGVGAAGIYLGAGQAPLGAEGWALSKYNPQAAQQLSGMPGSAVSAPTASGSKSNASAPTASGSKPVSSAPSIWEMMNPIGSAGAATMPNAGVPSGGPSITGGFFIKKQEGLSLNRYNDVGHAAIGYGHDITPAELRQGYISTASGRVSIGSGHITKAQANAIFAADYEKRFQHVSKVAGPEFGHLNANEQEAIMSYYYNTGRLPGGLASNLSRHDFHAVEESIRHGIHTVHGRSFAPLVRRRREEADLFDAPVASHTAAGSSTPAARVEIHNSTGGSAVVTASQIAA